MSLQTTQQLIESATRWRGNPVRWDNFYYGNDRVVLFKVNKDDSEEESDLLSELKEFLKENDHFAILMGLTESFKFQPFLQLAKKADRPDIAKTLVPFHRVEKPGLITHPDGTVFIGYDGENPRQPMPHLPTNDNPSVVVPNPKPPTLPFGSSSIAPMLLKEDQIEWRKLHHDDIQYSFYVPGEGKVTGFGFDFKSNLMSEGYPQLAPAEYSTFVDKIIEVCISMGFDGEISENRCLAHPMLMIKADNRNRDLVSGDNSPEYVYYFEEVGSPCPSICS